MDNLKFSKLKLGEMDCAIFQRHYTEKRIFRILGEDGKFSTLEINKLEEQIVLPDGTVTTLEQMVPGASRVRCMVNDITLGKYSVTVNETPLSASFQGAQFEEMMAILEKVGPSLGGQFGAFADLIIDASSLPRKDEWKQRWQQTMGMQLGIQPEGMPAAPLGMLPGPQPMPGPGVPPQIAPPAPPPAPAG